MSNLLKSLIEKTVLVWLVQIKVCSINNFSSLERSSTNILLEPRMPFSDWVLTWDGQSPWLCVPSNLNPLQRKENGFQHCQPSPKKRKWYPTVAFTWTFLFFYFISKGHHRKLCVHASQILILILNAALQFETAGQAVLMQG